MLIIYHIYATLSNRKSRIVDSGLETVDKAVIDV